jgi:protein AFG1
MTTAVPLSSLFMSKAEIEEAVSTSKKDRSAASPSNSSKAEEGHDLSDAMRSLMDDLGMDMSMLKNSSIFSGDEERFAFARALSRLTEMGSQEWVERGLGMDSKGGKEEMEGWKRVRSRWREDSM